MSDKLKCPFCKKELKLIGKKSDSGYPIDEYVCSCPETAFCFGNTVMWNELRVLQEKLEERREQRELAEKELIRTRKALDVAVDALKRIKNGREPICLGTGMDINDALEQITATLENKNGNC